MTFFQNYECKPIRYLAHVLGNEGKGSLLSYLRKKLWAVELDAGADDKTKLLTTFQIHIVLTESGFDHLDDVLEAIFSYLKMLKETGPNESGFREIQTIMANEFRFQSERDVFKNVQRLSVNLKQYPTKTILSGSMLLFKYDANTLQRNIDNLNKRNFNIMITSSKRYNESVTYESTESWFETKYTELDMPAKWITMWENIKPFAEFTLPEPNPFIADDFTIFHNDGNLVPKYPTKIFDNELCELWFRQDDKFLLPTASYSFDFTTPTFDTVDT